MEQLECIYECYPSKIDEEGNIRSKVQYIVYSAGRNSHVTRNQLAI